MEFPELTFALKRNIHDIPSKDWDRIAKQQGPFLQHAFLAALEDSQSVNSDSGWQVSHLAVYQMDLLIGIVPLYIKEHSYGEYVFDFSWANAYHTHGLEYYPKLVNAIPFTPVTGSRILLDKNHQKPDIYRQTVKYIITQAAQLGLSSFHSLFPNEEESKMLSGLGGLQRHAVQFQWFNRHYKDFSDYLSGFTARRRKSVRKEREKITAQHIDIERVSGNELSRKHMDFFYQCYVQTYLKRSGHGGYLNDKFFIQLLDTMQENILLVIAKRDDLPIACALYLFDDKQLCGRYWGALEDVDGLHFECCYYQGIEFCIENHLASFNPGTQGEHKILRGFEPIYTYSNHWMLHQEFHHAVGNFVTQEAKSIERYKLQSQSLLPFKQQD